MRKRALQEWNLLGSSNKHTWEAATTALRDRLNPGSQSMAAQDIQHARQRETIANFILRLEQVFRSACGQYGISNETRDTLLHGQLQEGLLYELMKVPAVTGAHKYSELCLAARNEEKQLVELKKRQEHTRQSYPD